MPKFSFTSDLKRPDGIGPWTYLSIPACLSKSFGTRRRLPRKGAINEQPFSNSALPGGEGSHYLIIARPIRDALQVTAGDKVNVVLEPAASVRKVIVPPDFAPALAANHKAGNSFERLSPSHQKERVEARLGAKRAGTRARRIEKATEMFGKKQRSRTHAA